MVELYFSRTSHCKVSNVRCLTLRYAQKYGVLDMTVAGSSGLRQCFSTYVRPQPGKFFFHKTRARSQHIYS